MPTKAQTALQRVIDARQRYCDWFDEMKLGTCLSRESQRCFVEFLIGALDVLPSEEASDKAARQRYCDWFDKMELGTCLSRGSQRYLVELLESTPDVLPPEEASDKAKKTSEADLSADQLEKDTILIEYATSLFFRYKSLTWLAKNAFKSLQFEDISDDEIELVADVTPADGSKQETHLYELKLNDQSQVEFVIFSFFEDLHRLRNELKQVWMRFRQGEVQLIHATLVTAAAAALEIVRQPV